MPYMSTRGNRLKRDRYLTVAEVEVIRTLLRFSLRLRLRLPLTPEERRIAKTALAKLEEKK